MKEGWRIWLNEGELKAVNKIQDFLWNRRDKNLVEKGGLKVVNELQDFHIFTREAVNEI